MSNQDVTVCCPPQKTESGPIKKAVAHPVSAKTGYEPKGKIEKLGDFDEIYVTGAINAKHAIVVVYDIFGFWESTIRGSDLLVEHLQTTKPTKVYMPDLFRGKPFPKEKDGDKEELQHFFSGTAKLVDRLPETLKFAEFLKNKEGFDQVSILGYCWGGKITLMALSSALEQQTPFHCGAIVHPAMIAPEEGDNLSVPLGFYPSQDEPKDVVDKIEHSMQGKDFSEQCDYHLYDTVHHGWAAARADLKDPENLKQYEGVYRRLADFYSKACC